MDLVRRQSTDSRDRIVSDEFLARKLNKRMTWCRGRLGCAVPSKANAIRAECRTELGRQVSLVLSEDEDS